MSVVNSNDILQCINARNRVPDKSEWKTTTSKLFKTNLAQYFYKKNKQNWIELGAAQGHTTFIISNLANKVLSIDNQKENCEQIDKLNLSNVTSSSVDLYSNEFKKFMENNTFDIAIIDAVHDEEHVKIDISNCILAGVKTIIFDDYGLIPGVKTAVDKFIKGLNNCKVYYIGMPVGTKYPNTINKILKDWEGVIVEIE